jgi:hypothetical protein
VDGQLAFGQVFSDLPGDQRPDLVSADYHIPTRRLCCGLSAALGHRRRRSLGRIALEQLAFQVFAVAGGLN